MLLKLISIGVKNLGRHKVKSLLTIIAVVISVWIYIFIDGWLYGMKIDSQRNIVNYETGAAKIYSTDYLAEKEDAPLYRSFGNWEPIISTLAANGYNAVPRVYFRGTLLFNNRELPFNLYGMDPELSKTVFSLDKYIESGDYIQNGVSGIVIGVKAAHDLGVSLGDTVTLYTTIDRLDSNNRVIRIPQVIYLFVAGILNTTDPYINNNIGYIPIDILNDNINGLQMDNRITEICISASDRPREIIPGRSESPEFINDILKDTDINGLSIVSWEEDAKDFLTIAQTKSKGTSLIIIFLFFLSIIGISNTMLMATLERTKEIGMMRAIGMKNSDVRLAFLSEAAMIGLIGGTIGFVLGFITNLYMVNIGIDFTEMMNAMGTDQIGYRVTGILKSGWNYKTLFGTLIASPLVSAAASLTAVNRSLRINISDSMRFE